DDVDFELNIASIISDTYRFLPSNWDIFFLGYCSYTEGSGRLLDGQSILSPYKIHKSDKPYCLHGYAVSRAGILKLVKQLAPITDTIDAIIVYLVQSGYLNSYSLVPLAMVQWRSSINPSSIAPEFKYHYFISLQHSALEQFELIKETNNTLGFNKIYLINYEDEPNYQKIVEKLSKMSDKLCLAFTNFNVNSSYSSHYEIYKSIINYEYGSALILEGDMDIELRITSIM
ncbi:9157_t:CDS:1, partial [Racocetra fulgida]